MEFEASLFWTFEELFYLKTTQEGGAGRHTMKVTFVGENLRVWCLLRQGESVLRIQSGKCYSSG